MALGAREDASVDEDHGSDPRNTHECWVGVAAVYNLSSRQRWDPWAGWLAGLAEPVRPTFNEKHCLSKQGIHR